MPRRKIFSISPTTLFILYSLVNRYSMKRLLWWLIAGTKGGTNRARIIILLHDRPYNANQIAERLRIPIGTVKSRTFRANQRLAQLLGHLRADTVPPTPRRAGEGPRRDPGSRGGGR